MVTNRELIEVAVGSLRRLRRSDGAKFGNVAAAVAASSGEIYLGVNLFTPGSGRRHAPTRADCVTAAHFELVISPTARRQLTERLPESVAFAAYDFIVGPLLENPHRVGKQLHPPLDDRHSARRGTYRVIYRIDDARCRVTVVGAVHRSDAYR